MSSKGHHRYSYSNFPEFELFCRLSKPRRKGGKQKLQLSSHGTSCSPCTTFPRKYMREMALHIQDSALDPSRKTLRGIFFGTAAPSAATAHRTEHFPPRNIRKLLPAAQKTPRLLAELLKDLTRPHWQPESSAAGAAFCLAVAQKTGTQNGRLVSGNMDQHLRNPPCLILSHSHLRSLAKWRRLQRATGCSPGHVANFAWIT